MSIIDKIKLNGTTYDVGKISDTTLTQSGQAADSKAVGDALANKVDKVTGKGLSTEDYTTAEKTKLEGLTQVEVDDTLSVKGRAADAKKTGDEIIGVKKDLNTFDCSVLFKNGYTESGGEKIGNFYESSGYVTALLHVEKGDVLTVSGIATESAITWAFATADKTITRRAEATTIYNKTVLTAEEGEAYFVYNDAVPANPQSYLTIKINRIVTLEEIRGDIDDLTSALNTFDCSDLFEDGTYATVGDYIGAFTAGAYKSCVLSVIPGDIINLTGIGTTSARLWAFADVNKEITRRADANAYLDNAELTVDDGEVYFVYNADASSTFHPPVLSIAINRMGTIQDLYSNISTWGNDNHKFNCSVLFDNGYRLTNGTKVGNLTASDNYKSCCIPVSVGDTVFVTGPATDNARVWAFADTDKIITRRANFETINNAVLTVQSGEAYLVYNDAIGSNPPAKLIVSTTAIKTVNAISRRIDALKEYTTQLATSLSDVTQIAKAKRLVNNLRTDGIDNLLPFGVKVYKNGVESPSNYGAVGARYLLDLGAFEKCHVRFKYRDKTYRPYSGTNVFASVATLGANNALNVEELYQSIKTQNGQIYRTSGHYPANKTSGITLSANPSYKQPLNGENAISIFYTGDSEITSTTTITAIFASGSITFSVNGETVGTATYEPTDSIQTLANVISNINGFICKVHNANGTVNDLLIDEMTISFINTATRNSTTVYGTQPVKIPYKVSDQWHLCEFIVDRTTQVAYVSYDGHTGKVTFSSSNALSDGKLALGGNYSAESGIEVCDLLIDINTYGDCELLEGAITNASTVNTRQLISDKNPRLMIFEGHGVFVGSESEAHTAYTDSGSDTSQEAMAVSTERLNIVFAELKSRGYEFVTMSDILSWKLGCKDLPKRCYTIIFDDYRVENYIDYEKRKPFVDWDIHPTLAMVSDNKALTDTVTINGISYTISDVLDIVNNAGWYMCSHTANHAYLSEYTISELQDMLKSYVLSCDNHKMHGNVIVYPYGAVNTATLKAVEDSGFALGVSIVEEYYNCKATINSRFTRTELGTRSSLENVLKPFI